MYFIKIKYFFTMDKWKIIKEIIIMKNGKIQIIL